MSEVDPNGKPPEKGEFDSPSNEDRVSEETVRKHDTGRSKSNTNERLKPMIPHDDPDDLETGLRFAPTIARIPSFETGAAIKSDDTEGSTLAEKPEPKLRIAPGRPMDSREAEDAPDSTPASARLDGTISITSWAAQFSEPEVQPGAIRVPGIEPSVDGTITGQSNEQEPPPVEAGVLVSAELVQQEDERTPQPPPPQAEVVRPNIRRRMIMIAIIAVLVVAVIAVIVYLAKRSPAPTSPPGVPTTPPVTLPPSTAPTSAPTSSLINETFADLAFTFTGMTQMSDAAVLVWQRATADYFVATFENNPNFGFRDVDTSYFFRAQEVPATRRHLQDGPAILIVTFDQTVSYHNEGSDLSTSGMIQLPYVPAVLHNHYVGALKATGHPAFTNLESVSALSNVPTPDLNIQGAKVAVSTDGSIFGVGVANGPVLSFRLPGLESTPLGGLAEAPPAGDLATAISGDGSRMVLGAEDSRTNGLVQVWSRDISGPDTAPWTLLGNEIAGTIPGGLFGESVAISADGTTIAVGAPIGGQVTCFRLVGGQWTLFASVYGRDPSDAFGTSVSLSNDGSTLAVGAPQRNVASGTGYVQMYTVGESSLTPLGDAIEGTAAGDRFGFSVSMSDDSFSVAVGAWGNDVNGEDSGSARVFAFDLTSSTWIPFGGPVEGDAAGDAFGYSVALGIDGTILAVGAPQHSTSKYGYIRAFRFSGGAWIEIQTFSPQQDGEQLGFSISMGQVTGSTLNVLGWGSALLSNEGWTYGFYQFSS